MKYRNYILICCTILVLVSCKQNVQTPNQPILETKNQLEHLNIILCSDLSNRLSINKQGIHDTLLIARFLDDYYPKIYKSSNRRIGQQDNITVLLYNGENIDKFDLNTKLMNINLSKFTDKDRIQYLQGKKGGFYLDKTNFKNEVNKLYSSVVQRVQGADTYNIFDSKIDRSFLKSDKKKGIYRNILLLFTDGYIEYGSNHRIGNKTYYLDQKLVNEFRLRFKRKLKKEIPSKQKLKDFFDTENYGIVPIENIALEELEVFIIGFNDRSLSKNSNTTLIPRDMDIIKLFWEDWLTKSKVKHFEIHPYFDTTEDFNEKIFQFIDK